MKADFKNCGKTVSPSDFVIVARTHARFSYSFLGWIFLQLDVLKKKYVKLGSGKMVRPIYFENIARTHVRVSYSISELMVIHFESMRLEKMNSWKFGWNDEFNMFWNCCSVSKKTSMLFSKSDFSSMVYSRKGAYEV